MNDGHMVDPTKDALTHTAQRAIESLKARGSLRSDARHDDLCIPPGFEAVLARALELEADHPVRGDRLRTHYLDWMPSQRVLQLSTTEDPEASIFHTPLDWASLPMMSAAIDGLFDLLKEAELDCADVLGVRTREAFKAQHETLAGFYSATYFGGFMPMLRSSAADMEAIADELVQEGVMAVIDARMTPPLLHEWMHFGRARTPLSPPYLDECIAGYLGVRAWRPFAFPPAGEDSAVYGAPWLAQVGQALARAIGVGPLIRAQVGAVSWSEVFPGDLLEATEALGWSRYKADRAPHFLTDTATPGPWTKLFLLSRAGKEVANWRWEDLEDLEPARIPLGGPPDDFDREILGDAIASMCLSASLVGRSFRVETKVPDGPIRLDPHTGLCTSSGRSDEPSIGPPSYFLPPSWCALQRESGIESISLMLRDPECIAYVVDALFCSRLDARGAGFEVHIDSKSDP